MLLSVLSDAEVELMHAKTLDVFENVGVVITHDEALLKLKQAGAKVDEASGRVRFPAKMVDELIAAAPSIAPSTGLNGKKLEIGGDNRAYLSLILDPFIIDHEKGCASQKLRPRYPTRTYVIWKNGNLARVVKKLGRVWT